MNIIKKAEFALTTDRFNITPDECDLARFVEWIELKKEAQIKQTTKFAIEVIDSIPIYDTTRLDFSSLLLLAEWANILQHGAGVFVLRQACRDLTAIDAATAIYEQLIAEEKTERDNAGDHFATGGSNDRLWNSLQKLATTAPEIFARYFANPAIDAVARSWLGTGYQMTAQVNIVHPEGKPQKAHRDYHLGFQTPEQLEQVPRHVHLVSPFLTLQGAIAHTDMPIETGPTRLLPFSQSYLEGYQAFYRQEFTDYFNAHYVSLPLQKGDALFFNPALFHAAGENRSKDVHRFANLLQISSPMARAMEAVDRTALCNAVYPVLLSGTFNIKEQEAIIAATAEGYSFPTNLERDPPIDGLAPKTQAQLMRDALAAKTSPQEFSDALMALAKRQEP